MVAIKETSEDYRKPPVVESDEGAKEALELLDKARSLLKRRLSFFVWQGFFEPLSAVSWIKDQLILEAPTSFHRNWVIDHYMAELNSAVAESCGQEVKIVIDFCNDNRKKIPIKKPLKEKAKSSSPKEKTIASEERTSPNEQKQAPVLPLAETAFESDAAILPLLSNSNLNPIYSFDSFIPGPSNQMGFTAAMSVADYPGMQFSPLFLFGGVGLGKTHLLHAIGLRAKKKNPQLRVVYISAEQWVNLYIRGIIERKLDSFRHLYRNGCDILLIDDIQFFAGKDASQDEFFHTFNSLHAAKKQIVVTSDKYPHEIEGLEERLKTRLSWGLIADIRPPEIETRIAILQKKAEGLSANLPDEIINFLATNVKSSVRELEGALLRIATCSSINKSSLSLAQAKEILTPIIKKKTVAVSWNKVCESVASYYDLRPADLISKSRQRQVVFARQVAMSICRSMLMMSLPEIGRAFGGRDHSTVLSSLRKIEEHKNLDISLQAVLQKLENKIATLANN